MLPCSRLSLLAGRIDRELSRGEGDLADVSPEPLEPSLVITPYGSKATVAAWSALDRFIVSGHEDGSVCLWDAEYGEEVRPCALAPLTLQYDKAEPNPHSGVITDLQMSPDRTWLVTSSKDKTAKVRPTLLAPV